MKRKFANVVILAVIAALGFGFASCGGEADEPGGDDWIGGGYSVDPKIEALSSELFNTSWTHQYTDFYTDEGGGFLYSEEHPFFTDESVTITFSNEIIGKNRYRLIVNGDSSLDCYWYIDEDGLTYDAKQYATEVMKLSTSLKVILFGQFGGAATNAKITTHTANKLVLRDFEDDGVKFTQPVFNAATNPGGGGNSGGGTGGGSSSYEEPEIGFYDYTPTKNSIKVQYKIYNKDEAEVSSAKIYYGTSTNPSSYKTATVNGVIISANITGLKSGTSYYVKCVATGKGGQTTTTVTRCMTDY